MLGRCRALNHNASRPAPSDVPCAEADYPTARTFLIYGGERELNQSGIRVLSVENALRELPDLLS